MYLKPMLLWIATTVSPNHPEDPIAYKTDIETTNRIITLLSL